MFNNTHIARETGYFFTALTFLTRLPVSKWSNQDKGALLKSAVYFPMVGLLVGTLCGLTYSVCDHFWNDNIAIIAALITGMVLTGALHEDGFADLFDSMGAFDKQKKLKIMKDSRIGTYGVCALVSMLLLKFFALSAISNNLIFTFVVAHVVSRWIFLPLIHFNEYVSENAKSGADLLVSTIESKRLVIASLITLLILFSFDSGNNLSLILSTVVIFYVCQYYFRKTFDGITGDCLGAANQITETTLYLVIAIHV